MVFTVRTTVEGETETENEFEYCSDAWIDFGKQVTTAGKVMQSMESMGFPVVHVKMAYMIDSSVEVEYAQVTLA